MPHLTARLLGPVRLSVDGQPAEITSVKARGLLCYLIASRQIHSRDRLAGFFWPEVPERNALASLRTALYDIRRGLGDAHRHFLLVDRARLGFVATSSYDLDLATIEAVTPDRDNPGLDALEAAAAAYDGPFLNGLSLPDSYDFEDWVFLERERYEQLFIASMCRLVDAYADAGQLELASTVTRRILAIDPLREDVHRTLMELLARSGRRAEALAQYRNCCEILERELGIAPLGATQTLYRQILESEETSFTSPSLPRGQTALSRAARRRAVVSPPDNPLDVRAGTSPLVGRESALEFIAQRWALVESGTGGVVVLSGEAGVGKTRLVSEFALDIDAHVLVGSCFESSASQPYTPITEAIRRGQRSVDVATLGLESVWLRELARLAPELGPLAEGSNAPLDGVRDRDRLFDAVRIYFEAVAASRPVVLVVEDVQWCDETTLSLIAALARHTSSQRILILLTARPEELYGERRKLVRSLLRDGVALDLEPLGPKETALLVSGLAEASTIPTRFGGRLFERTGGNPFFVIETLRALFDQGTLQLTDGEWTTSAGLAEEGYGGLPVPARVGLLIDTRLDRLTDDERALLEVAATLRRDFTFDSAQSASGVDARASLDALDKLLRVGLLREVDAGVDDAARYDFNHALVRERVYERLSGARRQYLHRQLAGHLEASGTVEAERIAYHYLRGGVRERACAWSLRAGQLALQKYAAEDALGHYRAALELAAGDEESHAALSGIGDAEVLLGRPREGVASFQRALDFTDNPEDQAELFRRIGRAHERQGEFDKALEAYDECRGRLEGTPPNLTSIRAADGLATVYVRLGRPERAIALSEEALAWLARHTDLEGVQQAEAWVRNTLGMAHLHSGNHLAAIPHLERSLALKRKAADDLGEATLLNNLGVVHYRLGNDERARDLYADSLRIKERIGDGYGRAIALTNLALMETHLGSYELAASHLEAAERAAGEVNAAWLVPEIHRVSAQRFLDLGLDEDALREAEEALTAAEELGVPTFIGVAHRVLGLVKARKSDGADAADEHFLTSIAVFEMQDDEHELAKTRAAYAAVLAAEGRQSDALAHARAAAEVFRRTGAIGRLSRIERLTGEA